MRGWMILIAVVIFGPSAAAQQVVNLTESISNSDCYRVEIRTKVDGERIYFQDGAKKSQPVKLEAGHRWAEKVLNINDKTGMPSKVVRNYEAARSTLTVGSDRSTQQTLRMDRAFMVAVRNDEGLTVFSPRGTLFQEELELIGEHFDTLVLAGLLPGKEIPIGNTWQLDNAAVLGLCLFEGLEHQSLTGRLETVAGELAKVSIYGNAKGVESGAQVVLTISATLTYDLVKKSIVNLEWKQEDQRDQGPLSPGFKATVNVTLNRSTIKEPTELGTAAMAFVPAGLAPPPSMTALTFRDSRGQFEMTQPRGWRLTSINDPHTILRLVERGELMAQATITILDRAKPGEHMDKADFKQKMLASPGWKPGQVIEEGEVRGRGNRYIYRMSVGGSSGDRQVVQIFYLVAEPTGEQVVVAFEADPQKATKLGGRLLAFVDGVELSPRR